MSLLSCRFSQDHVAATAANAAALYAPGQPLRFDWVIEDSRFVAKVVREYFDQMPPGMKEAVRATIYAALTSDPPTPMLFQWEARYEWVLQVRQTPNTVHTPGMINIIIGGRYAPDVHPLADDIRRVRQAGAGASSRRAVTKGAKSGAKPAKRKASKR
ncbi:MAG: hypothetical protein AB7J28_09435 [Hyphomonadaceae bacterium]